MAQGQRVLVASKYRCQKPAVVDSGQDGGPTRVYRNDIERAQWLQWLIDVAILLCLRKYDHVIGSGRKSIQEKNKIGLEKEGGNR